MNVKKSVKNLVKFVKLYQSAMQEVDDAYKEAKEKVKAEEALFDKYGSKVYDMK